jgi:hypothetical protein
MEQGVRAGLVRTAVVVLTSAAVGLVLLPVPAQAEVVQPAATTAPTATPKPSPAPAPTCTRPRTPAMNSPYPRLYRPTTKYGMKDKGVKSIKHVREAQYRLKWTGYYKGSISGYYGVRTRDAVRAFQKRNCLARTGTLDRATWARLIIKSTKQLSRVPKVCKTKGWHSCYDRKTHQTFLYRNGQLQNVWLVRGGARSTPTRTGTYRVFARYALKISTLYDVPMWYFQKHSGGQGHHGSGFMLDPFVGHSHGCINMYITDAQVLWALTKDKKLTVTVYGAWS